MAATASCICSSYADAIARTNASIRNDNQHVQYKSNSIYCTSGTFS
jgi:hypothetical protein